jgi:hypothetical protein
MIGAAGDKKTSICKANGSVWLEIIFTLFISILVVSNVQKRQIQYFLNIFIKKIYIQSVPFLIIKEEQSYFFILISWKGIFKWKIYSSDYYRTF